MSMANAHTGAHVVVLSPALGTVVTGESVPFSVSLSNLRVDCSSACTPDHAHVGRYHVTLINMYCGPKGRVSMLDVKPGKHILGVIPATNEHADDMSAAKMIPIVYWPAGPVQAVAAQHLRQADDPAPLALPGGDRARHPHDAHRSQQHQSLVRYVRQARRRRLRALAPQRRLDDDERWLQ
jgi:hypothetical protein